MNSDYELYFLKEGIKAIVKDLISERSKKPRRRRKKPGGGLTDFGAQRHLNPKEWEISVSKELYQNDGDVADAAKDLGVAKRTLHLALQQNSKLKKAKDRAKKEDQDLKCMAKISLLVKASQHTQDLAL